DRPGKDALERLLADAVKRTAPLVGLGSHGKIEFGFGSAGLAPDWKDRVSKIMETASYIFVVPSVHEGTLWELGEIKKKGYFDKSGFIMPRVDPPFQYSGAQDYKQVWDEARAACEREHGIDLPEYVSSGALFRFDEQSRVCRVEGSLEARPREVAKAINKLREEPTDWQWIGLHMMPGPLYDITEARAKAYAERHGGTASKMSPHQARG